jgi:hypothetical protein
LNDGTEVGFGLTDQTGEYFAGIQFEQGHAKTCLMFASLLLAGSRNETVAAVCRRI